MASSTTPALLHLTLHILAPVPNFAYALQQGKDALGEIRIADGTDLRFDVALTVRTARSGEPDLGGPWVHGPLGARFLYLNSGSLAGQFVSVWTRRAKIPLGDLVLRLAQGTLSVSAHVEGSVAGRSRDGGPICASTPLQPPGWQVLATTG